MSEIEPLLRGDRRAIARAITRVERGGAEAQALLAAVYPHGGRAYVVGVTGAPGTGKSTLVTQLAQAYRAQGKTVGIVAVDPTSPFTGGAILGDRVRMQALSGDPGIFIRSMATRGNLGGLAWATRDAITILDAAGFELIIVETVGAGQSEVDIAQAAHTTLVVTVPGLGDDIQTVKAGILEIADVFVVNKADLPHAEQVVAQLRTMLNLNPNPDSWRPPIVKTIALTGEGVTELIAAIQQHRIHLEETGEKQRRERARMEKEVLDILRNTLLAKALDGVASEYVDELVDQVAARELDPYTAAQRLMQR